MSEQKNKHKLFFNKKFLITVAIAVLLFFNFLQLALYTLPRVQRRAELPKNIDAGSKFTEIENYLDRISPDFIQDVQGLADQYNIPSWGCGPSSYALAKIIDNNFFSNALEIRANYNGRPYEIVERISFAQDTKAGAKYNVVDHAWIEIYVNDKMLVIDPTVGQFGKINKIAYFEFATGDPKIGATLAEKLDIIDIRFVTLMQKAINRIPASQPPYPGATINPDSMEYYLGVLRDRDALAQAQEPDDWKDWVSTLYSKFAS